MVSRKNFDRLVGRIKWGEDTLALVIFSAMSILPVSYTHLTLPTILLV